MKNLIKKTALIFMCSSSIALACNVPTHPTHPKDPPGPRT